MMKKNNLLILAVAALGFAACSSDETTAVNEKLAESNVINFRANVNGVMRAADITSASDIKTINVYATKASDASAVYFANEEFVGPGTYTSVAKHYWPSYPLDFYAWSAIVMLKETLEVRFLQLPIIPTL